MTVGSAPLGKYRGCSCHHAPLRLQADAPPAGPVDTLFSFNTQDRRVMEPGTKLIPGVVQGSKKNPETDKAMLNVGLDPVDGKYVYPAEDPRQNTAVTFSTVANTINAFREAFGDFKWSFKYDKLAVNPNGGKDFNAFYARNQGTVNFFSEEDPIFGRQVFSGASGEIVAHETGHAILDAIRPEYFGAFRSDVGAFHESFGDMLAIHMSLLDERVIKRVLVQTGGDLKKPNIAAYMAEELAQGLNNKKGTNATGGDFLRNANNNFTWAEPKTLPEKGGPDKLGWEIHDFSRLWTASHFDILNGMVQQRIQDGAAPDVAIRESNKELLKMLANLLKEAPRGDFTFKDMAIAFIKSDKIHADGKHVELLQKVFTERKILPADLPAETFETAPARERARLFQSDDELTPEAQGGAASPLAPPAYGQMAVTLGQDFGMYSGARVEIPVASDRLLFKSDELQEQTQDDIRRLIQAGRIRYNDPNYQMKFPNDYFNPQGEAYIGAVVWEGDQMKIERLAIAH
ncbi:MAG: hypothetical protein KF760_19775 [Candidatus Eremiobacteraeota bacterium]|nr:hypothetical protein [Candidatus Eremiobacteraeota bacterium]MCW5869149.1 hypothetical protein [Candidatus Eremiobacteraeota bacterium]